MASFSSSAPGDQVLFTSPSPDGTNPHIHSYIQGRNREGTGSTNHIHSFYHESKSFLRNPQKNYVLLVSYMITPTYKATW